MSEQGNNSAEQGAIPARTGTGSPDPPPIREPPGNPASGAKNALARPSRGSPPARLFAEIDAECGLGDDLVTQEGVRRMKAAASAVAEQPLQLVGAKHAGTAGDLHRLVDDPPARLDRVLLGRDDLCRPGGTMLDPVRPILGDPVEM